MENQLNVFHLLQGLTNQPKEKQKIKLYMKLVPHFSDLIQNSLHHNLE